MVWQSWIVETEGARQRTVNALVEAARACRRYETPGLLALELTPEVANTYRQRGDLNFYPDFRLKPCTTTPLNPAVFRAFKKDSGLKVDGLNEVLEMIGAPSAWEKSTGQDTFIAIVDSGVHGKHLEFPLWKKAGGFSADGANPWRDKSGHGTMCAAIAAASPVAGARVSGVAPDAKLYSCQFNYTASQAIAAYEWIQARHREHGKPVIVSNSFGFETSTLPIEYGLPVTPDHPMAKMIGKMVRDGMPMVFAAGNNHPDKACTHPRTPCDPDTIWGYASLPEVMCVADIDEHRNPRTFSSRGPGQWHHAGPAKPDCAAPTFGLVLFGKKYREADAGWGTSGAAPQVAGLLALLMSQRPGATPAELNDRIRDTCKKLSACGRCVGHGMIQCDRAVW